MRERGREEGGGDGEVKWGRKDEDVRGNNRRARGSYKTREQ